jgi:hypothetical protein
MCEDTGRSKLLYGLFIGVNGQLSISLFQIFVWTVVTLWALFYVWGVTGSLLAMTSQILGLLGIASVGSVTGRAIGRRTRGEGAVNKAINKKEKIEIKFWSILEEGGRFDLYKLQLFLFTLAIAGYVMYRVLLEGAFPELSNETLLLMGISNGTYVGGKVAARSKQPTPAAEQKNAQAQTGGNEQK